MNKYAVVEAFLRLHNLPSFSYRQCCTVPVKLFQRGKIIPEYLYSGYRTVMLYQECCVYKL